MEFIEDFPEPSLAYTGIDAAYDPSKSKRMAGQKRAPVFKKQNRFIMTIRGNIKKMPDRNDHNAVFKVPYNKRKLNYKSSIKDLKEIKRLKYEASIRNTDKSPYFNQINKHVFINH